MYYIVSRDADLHGKEKDFMHGAESFLSGFVDIEYVECFQEYHLQYLVPVHYMCLDDFGAMQGSDVETP